uniref:Outer membrane protein beta-barrel domain-containing protein n=1 Tax=candidate division WOR-3 bacterium TaxID=2052148 RepID=A0A7V1EH20_UNCW3
MKNNTIKCISLLGYLILINTTCISPTFESSAVHKGNQSWVGFAGGYRCFDHSKPAIFHGYSFESTYGISLGAGFNYGFTDNIGLVSSILFYRMNGYYDGFEYQTISFLSMWLASKFELTRNTSRDIFSVSIGPAFPEIVKLNIMYGAKGAKNTIVSFGTHLSFYYPYDFYINIGPAEGSGFVIYLGHQIPYFNNPLNLAVGIGYRLK